MKKVWLLLLTAAILSLPLFLLAAQADEAVVFIGGEGDSYATLAAAAADLPASGGTIVVRGPLDHPTGSAVNMPAKKVTVTSVWENADYAETAGAYFGLGRTLNLYAQLTFENITVKMTATGSYGNIYGRGNPLIVGEGVTTVANASTGKYPALFGGFSAANSGTGYQASVSVASGTWQNVYGGSYLGAFNGESRVTVTGGKIVELLCGGSRNGTQTGNTHLDFSGGETNDLCGGVYGVSGSSGALTGDIEIDVHGTAKVLNNVFGAAYYSNIVFNGSIDIDLYGDALLYRHVYAGCYGTKDKANVTLGSGGSVVRARENVRFVRPSDASNVLSAGSLAGTVKGNVRVVVADNAYFPGNVYAAGYSGSVDGNSTAEITGGEVRVNFTAASRSGSVTGTATTIARGGKIGYYSASEPYSLLGNNTGTVGAAVVLLDGADVGGKVSLGGAVGTVTLKSGSASYCEDVCAVDLSDGGLLSVGGTLNASSIVGGGILRVPATTTVSAGSLSGSLVFQIAGEPVANQTYLTVAEKAAGAEVLYTPVDDEVLSESEDGGVCTYTMLYGERYDVVTVRIYYYNHRGTGVQPNAVLRRGVYSGGEKIEDLTAGTEGGKNYIEASLAPGLYGCKVYYGNGSSDYRIKYFYVSGKTAAQEYDLPLEPYVENSWSENVFSNLTDEVAALFGTDDLIGYEGFDTPTFSLDGSVRNFMNNTQLCDYVDALAADCEYLYLYYPFAESAMGNRTPVLVFTLDDIGGMSFDEAAACLRARHEGKRDIVLITGGKHGNEPAGIEGALVFSKDLTGAYGEEVLEKIGAIVVIPSVEVDNNQRFKRDTADGINPNRDLIAVNLDSSKNHVYVYKSFMPSVTIDCHEDGGNSDIDPGDFSVENLDDLCIRYSSNFNSPIHGAILQEGTFDANALRGTQIMMDALARVRETGLRSAPYYSASTAPTTTSTYSAIRGAYAFLVETMRIWTGTGRYARAVFGMEQGLKALIAEVIEADGALAADVYANRARVASTAAYDENNLFAGKHSSSGIHKVYAPRPTVFVSGVWKDADAVKAFNLTDTLSDMIILPTAYVVSADAERIGEVLEILDLQGIPYTKLKAGASMTLRRYSGGYENTVIGAAEEVTFEHGAYAVTMNNSDAYLIAYLFEPNSHRFTSEQDHQISFEHMGKLSDADGLYRSEEDNVYLTVAALKDAPAALAFTLFSRTAEDDAVIRLYPASLSDAEIRADLAEGTLALDADAQKGEIVSGGNGYTQSVTFSADAGEYKLAIFKAGKHAPRVLAVTLAGDLDLGEVRLLLYGDANDNGAVNAQDALQIARFAAGKNSVFGSTGDADWESYRLFAAAVVSGGTSPNAQDALQIARCAAGKVSVFAAFG
ncbi:MAG: hypothetical protein IJR89_06735 [Clostridia bacterium]|nr:hypothetical protein [Clostridia bacterium]